MFNHNTFTNLPKNEFGVIGSSATILGLAEATPNPEVYEKSGLNTFNNMGVDRTFTGKNPDSWLINDFLECAKNSDFPVLEIGAGFGGISIKALQSGATVIANDLDMNNLLFGVKSIKDKSLLKNLYLNTDSFPKETAFPPHSIGMVFSYRVWHHLTGNDIEDGIVKIKDWIVPGGKVFIGVNSPHSNAYSSWVEPMYEQEWQKNNLWPGEYVELARAYPKAKNITKYIHVMDERSLCTAFKKYGFIIEKTGFIPNELQVNNTITVDAKAFFGLIASKI